LIMKEGKKKGCDLELQGKENDKTTETTGYDLRGYLMPQGGGTEHVRVFQEGGALLTAGTGDPQNWQKKGASFWMSEVITGGGRNVRGIHPLGKELSIKGAKTKKQWIKERDQGEAATSGRGQGYLTHKK